MREVEEVAGWIVGRWLQITGCVHTDLRARTGCAMAAPDLPRGMTVP